MANTVQPLLLSMFLLSFACGDDNAGTQADRLGVGAECATNADCPQSAFDGGLSQRCLQQFKGGYCGIEDCRAAEDCPQGSACVAHTDGNNYCFRVCVDKSECNLNRSPDNESNCSANVDYVGTGKAGMSKACVPPSG